MTHPHTAARRRPRQRRGGAAVVEMAFVLPVLLIFLVATMDLGLIVYAYGMVAEASRTGARYAIVHGKNSSSPVGPTANDTTVATVVKNNAVGLNTSQITVTSSWGTGSNVANSPVTVTVSYQVQLATGRLVGLNSLTVQSSTTMLITH
jgi:Flp pilus assembly protein TadG